MTTDILVGRKAICLYLGVSWDTVKKWIRDRGFPVLRENGCQPILSIAAVADWEKRRRELIKKTQRENGDRPPKKSENNYGLITGEEIYKGHIDGN